LIYCEGCGFSRSPVINDPDVLFLDEPTLGLDVISARLLRKIILKWAKEGGRKAVLLTTHYMYEADEVCDMIGILSKGRILAIDTPRRLKQSIAHKTSVKLELRNPQSDPEWLNAVKGVEGFTKKDTDGALIVRVVLSGEEHVADLLSACKQRGIDLTSFSKSEPTLEDVYVAYVGGELTHE